jgi:HEAT repeat protein
VDHGCQEPLRLYSKLLWKDPKNLNYLAHILPRLGPKARPLAPALVEICRQRETYRDLFLTAAAALADIDPVQARLTVGALVEKVKDEDLNTVQTLAKIDLKNPALLPVFLKWAKQGRLLYLPLDYYTMFAEKTADVVPALIEGLQHEQIFLSAAAVLGKIGPKAAAAVPELMLALHYPERQRGAAIEALGQIGAGSKEVLPCLLRLLQDPQEKQRQTVIEAVAAMGSAARPAVPMLNPWLKDRQLRVFAAEALWRITGSVDPSLNTLIECLEDKNDEIQQRAAQVLKTMGPKAGPAVPKLQQLLRDIPDSELPTQAAQALGALGPKARVAIPDLVRLLSAENSNTRSAAAEALGEIGGAAQIPPLAVLVEDDPVMSVAEAAELALKKIHFRLKTRR